MLELEDSWYVPLFPIFEELGVWIVGSWAMLMIGAMPLQKWLFMNNGFEGRRTKRKGVSWRLQDYLSVILCTRPGLNNKLWFCGFFPDFEGGKLSFFSVTTVTLVSSPIT